MCIQNGYGFVHFPLTNEGIKSALQAVEALHQVTINHISYDCSVSNQLRQVLSQMERNPGALKNQGQGGYGGGGRMNQYNNQQQGGGFQGFNGNDQQQIPYGSLPPRGGGYANGSGSAYQNRQFHQNQGGMYPQHNGGNNNNMFPPALYGGSSDNISIGSSHSGGGRSRFNSTGPPSLNNSPVSSYASIPSPPPFGSMNLSTAGLFNNLSSSSSEGFPFASMPPGGPRNVSNASPSMMMNMNMNTPRNGNPLGLNGASSLSPPPTLGLNGGIGSTTFGSGSNSHNNSFSLQSGSGSASTGGAWGSFHSNVSTTPPTPSSISSLNANAPSFNATGAGVAAGGSSSLLSNELDALNVSTNVDSLSQKLDVTSLLEGNGNNNTSNTLLIPNPGKFTSNLTSSNLAPLSSVTSVGNISPFPSEASTDGEGGQVFSRDFTGDFLLNKPASSSSALSFGSTPTSSSLLDGSTIGVSSSAPTAWGSFKNMNSMLDNVFDLPGASSGIGANGTSLNVSFPSTFGTSHTNINTATTSTSASSVASVSQCDEMTNLKTELSVDEQLEALWFEN